MRTETDLPIPGGPFARSRQDHADLLARLDEIERRALTDRGSPDESALNASLDLLGGRFASHMSDEDASLYPAIQSVFPAGRSTLEALRADHVELRVMMASIAEWRAAPSSTARDEQLQVALRDLVDLLRLHIHREESALFDVASRVLSLTETQELARRLAPLVEPDPHAGDEPEAPKGTHP